MIDEKIKIIKIIAEKIKQNGGEAYFVGGFVRDKIMGQKNDDIDIEVHKLSPDVLRKILKDTASYSEVGKSFGIFILNDYKIDVALPRKDIQTGKGHRNIDVCVDPFLGTIEAARRRDFTINSVMENIITGEIIDHFNGIKDIKDKVIRHVDNKTFADDPLRILRGAQFSARFNFKIADETIKLSKTTDLSILSKERIYEETKKALLKAENPSLYFESIKLMEHISPWFKELSFSDDKWHCAMESIDKAAKLKDETENPLGFMFFSVCSMLENVEDVLEFLSRITEEKQIKKYAINLHSKSKDLYKAWENKIDTYETNRIFDSALDKKGVIFALKIQSHKNAESINFAEKRLIIYNKTISEGFLCGKDLINEGFIDKSKFSDALATARSLTLKGYSKAEIIRLIKTQFL